MKYIGMEFFLLLISKVIETITIIPIYMSTVLEIKTRDFSYL